MTLKELILIYLIVIVVGILFIIKCCPRLGLSKFSILKLKVNKNLSFLGQPQNVAQTQIFTIFETQRNDDLPLYDEIVQLDLPSYDEAINLQKF